MKKTILLILVATMSINITIAQDSTAFQGVSGNPIEEFVEEESEPDILEDEQNSKEENYSSDNEFQSGNEEVYENSNTTSSNYDMDYNDSTSSQESEPIFTFTKDQKDKFIRWFVIGLTLIIVMMIISYRYKRRCDRCGKWNSMKVIDKVLIDEKASSITEERKCRDRNGNVTHTYEVEVPATIYTYNIYRRCKHCGYKDILRRIEKVKN